MPWSYGPEVPLREERHFDDRVMSCFAQRPSSPFEAFTRAVAQRPQGLALVAGASRLSYAELDLQALRVAHVLASKGVGPGDRVAMLVSNRAEFITTLLAALRLGAIVVPLGTRLQAPEIAYIVGHSGAAVLVHDEALSARLPIAEQVPTLRASITAEEVGRAAASDGWPASGGGQPSSPYRAEEEAVAAILYTSGTTGKPKGATLTHFNLVHSMLNYQYSMKMGPQDRTVMAVPASHVTGLVANIMLAWAAQCTLVVMPEFKARTFLELAAQEQMTHTVIVPAMYNLCLLQPDFSSFDLTGWRVGGYGGAPMAETTIAGLARELPSLGLYNIYGSTETTSPVTMLPSTFAALRPDSTGFALPCVEILVVNEAGLEVPPGESGELWIRGPMVVPGYWANPEASASGFTDGYWRSGDVGSVDAGGFVRVFDRLKDMLNRGGYKIYSVEVENVLLEHPDVVESAIIGKPCPVLGERVHAFVQLKPDSKVSGAALSHFCSERLADYKVPESFTLGSEPLPRNANGKLLKREMRNLLTT
jgi:acyl-CoA synthetase (AMP-forming)/AMP-acid ligase II